jgi:hypothetical protein
MGLTQKLGTIPQVSTNYLPKSLSGSFANSLIQDDGSTTTITGASETLRLTTTGASNYFAYRNSSNTQIGDIGYDGRDTDGLSIWNNVSNGNLVFGAGAARRMTILGSNGYVGINSTSPISQLSVRGAGGSSGVTLTLENGGGISSLNDPLGILSFYSNDPSAGASGEIGRASCRERV